MFLHTKNRGRQPAEGNVIASNFGKMSAVEGFVVGFCNMASNIMTALDRSKCQMLHGTASCINSPPTPLKLTSAILTDIGVAAAVELIFARQRLCICPPVLDTACECGMHTHTHSIKNS